MVGLTFPYPEVNWVVITEKDELTLRTAVYTVQCTVYIEVGTHKCWLQCTAHSAVYRVQCKVYSRPHSAH